MVLSLDDIMLDLAAELSEAPIDPGVLVGQVQCLYRIRRARRSELRIQALKHPTQNLGLRKLPNDHVFSFPRWPGVELRALLDRDPLVTRTGAPSIQPQSQTVVPSHHCGVVLTPRRIGELRQEHRVDHAFGNVYGKLSSKGLERCMESAPIGDHNLHVIQIRRQSVLQLRAIHQALLRRGVNITRALHFGYVFGVPHPLGFNE
ncbi:hypothetical protein [Dyella humicola]|uniref:hypothetical protein n=1 Tax=Dyella humicola TaxID=2992126 RepID=UPI002255C5B1|nr:hypothetical protein [Dyella humicola]